jgi:hypothetical protein
VRRPLRWFGSAVWHVVGGLLGLLLAAQLAVVGHDPSCPTEDSCQPLYEDGRWVVVEVTP